MKRILLWTFFQITNKEIQSFDFLKSCKFGNTRVLWLPSLSFFHLIFDSEFDLERLRGDSRLFPFDLQIISWNHSLVIVLLEESSPVCAAWSGRWPRCSPLPWRLLSSSGPSLGRVKVRCRSGAGQMRVRKVRVRSESCELKDFNINLRTWTWAIHYFWFSPPPTTHHPHKLFSWLLRGLDKLDEPRMGWYNLTMVSKG